MDEVEPRPSKAAANLLLDAFEALSRLSYHHVTICAMVGVQKAVKGLSLNLHVLGGIVMNLAPALVPLRHRLVPMGICRPMSKACICHALGICTVKSLYQVANNNNSRCSY